MGYVTILTDIGGTTVSIRKNEKEKQFVVKSKCTSWILFIAFIKSLTF